MGSAESKRLALLRVLQILQTHSDGDHPLKQEDIVQRLECDYGIVIERKAIGRILSLLREADFDIVSDRRGSYLNEREFTESELRVLIDGVLSSKYISAHYTKGLIDKLCGLTSKFFRSHVDHIHSVDEWDKTENRQLFFNIERVDEAIEQKKQIRFAYNKYDIDKKLHKTRYHNVSPYQMILHKQKYYLMARSEYMKKLVFYRMDRITGMTIIEKPLLPITELDGYKNGINYSDISTALPYMYTDPPERVEFVADKEIVDQIIDCFGKDTRIVDNGDKTFTATIRVSPMAMEHWALQFAGKVRVISPQPLVDSIKNRLKEAVKIYES